MTESLLYKCKYCGLSEDDGAVILTVMTNLNEVFDMADGEKNRLAKALAYIDTIYVCKECYVVNKESLIKEVKQ